MGMDVYGSRPSSPEGEYFRASIWSWAPIHKALCKYCSDLFTDEELWLLSSNDGAGPKGQHDCVEIAKRFQMVLAKYPEGLKVETSIRVDHNGRFLSQEEVERVGFSNTLTPFVTPSEQLKEWITFLKHCGGFSVC